MIWKVFFRIKHSLNFSRISISWFYITLIIQIEDLKNSFLSSRCPVNSVEGQRTPGGVPSDVPAPATTAVPVSPADRAPPQPPTPCCSPPSQCSWAICSARRTGTRWIPSLRRVSVFCVFILFGNFHDYHRQWSHFVMVLVIKVELMTTTN